MYTPGIFYIPADLTDLLDTEDEMDEIYSDIIERVRSRTMSPSHLKDLPPYLRRSISGISINLDFSDEEGDSEESSAHSYGEEDFSNENEERGEELHFAIDIDSEEELELQARMFASDTTSSTTNTFFSLPTRPATPNPDLALDPALASPSPLHAHANPSYTSSLSSLYSATDLSTSPPTSPTSSDGTNPFSYSEQRIWSGPEHGYCTCTYSSWPAESGSAACANHHHPWAQEERSRIQGRGHGERVRWWRERQREVGMVYGGSGLKVVTLVGNEEDMDVNEPEREYEENKDEAENESVSSPTSSVYSPVGQEHDDEGTDDVMVYDAEDEGENADGEYEEDDPLPAKTHQTPFSFLRDPNTSKHNSNLQLNVKLYSAVDPVWDENEDAPSLEHGPKGGQGTHPKSQPRQPQQQARSRLQATISDREDFTKPIPSLQPAPSQPDWMQDPVWDPSNPLPTASDSDDSYTPEITLQWDYSAQEQASPSKGTADFDTDEQAALDAWLTLPFNPKGNRPWWARTPALDAKRRKKTEELVLCIGETQFVGREVLFALFTSLVNDGTQKFIGSNDAALGDSETVVYEHAPRAEIEETRGDSAVAVQNAAKLQLSGITVIIDICPIDDEKCTDPDARCGAGQDKPAVVLQDDLKELEKSVWAKVLRTTGLVWNAVDKYHRWM